MVTITAPAEQDGKPFARWKVEAGDITLDEETARQTTFVMGSLDVEVTACYDTKDSPTPASGGDGDGGGAGISVGAILGRHDGFNEEVKVENCTVSGKINVQGGEFAAVGGIIGSGYQYSTSANNCTSKVDITYTSGEKTSYYVGPLQGVNVSLNNCTSTGKVIINGVERTAA